MNKEPMVSRTVLMPIDLTGALILSRNQKKFHGLPPFAD